MGYKYLGDVVINASLTVDTPKPLDSRTVVEDLTELYNIPEKSAYQGMTVANINDGNLYMLIDKSKIAEKAGWKASYESILIITCTQEEYNTWALNTTEDYKPIDGNLVYLRRDVYYYIYEDEDNAQYYVTKKQIEDWLGAKASSVDLDGLRTVVSDNKKAQDELNTTVTNLITSIETDYITATQIAEIYTTIEALNSVDGKFSNYYTSEKVDELFVTKESLRGGLEGNDDFVFVTLNQYNQDKQEQAESISTKQILLQEIPISTNAEELLFNSKELAFKESVPKLVMVTGSEYETLKESSQIDPDIYYCTYDDKVTGYLTEEAAKSIFFTMEDVNRLMALKVKELVDDYITPLQNRVAALESSLI